VSFEIETSEGEGEKFPSASTASEKWVSLK
jgi:hypothetical protein